MKSYTQRFQVAHTLQALLAIRHDIEHGALANIAGAKEQLRRFANQRSREMGYKGEWWE